MRRGADSVLLNSLVGSYGTVLYALDQEAFVLDELSPASFGEPKRNETCALDGTRTTGRKHGSKAVTIDEMDGR